MMKWGMEAYRSSLAVYTFFASVEPFSTGQCIIRSRSTQLIPRLSILNINLLQPFRPSIYHYQHPGLATCPMLPGTLPVWRHPSISLILSFVTLLYFHNPDSSFVSICTSTVNVLVARS
ncbi:hypothetical protein BU24DRAFT_23159 [Aaosphaeria arxii CBS 175.79]|uniref:Uncharacterized protein n=1 Tax=Aaosphaeria arxii CBS 175.79 TaxID=1450172 RepID=A0A6A5Y861_9PLEO|nr:uncharacterized protein BU24DRAFT_23159 [Aaosphaeria arxii CBS 175.79]KAF2021578.1 hypothetical protein BU24DRAFT_23159 [Aaosphaeria arxii CBS 175.79]